MQPHRGGRGAARPNIRVYWGLRESAGMRQGEKVRVVGGRGESTTLGLWNEIPRSAPIGESSQEDEGRLINNGRRARRDVDRLLKGGA